jgi:hypothetical protein
MPTRSASSLGFIFPVFSSSIHKECCGGVKEAKTNNPIEGDRTLLYSESIGLRLILGEISFILIFIPDRR